MEKLLSTLAATVESLVGPFEKVAAYLGIGSVGVANQPHLPASVRAVVVAVGGLIVAADRKSKPAAIVPVDLSKPAPQAPPIV